MLALINGLAFGLVLAFFIGPVFFALIQTSIQRGFVAGVGMALGVCISDSIYLWLSYLGVSQLLNNDSFKLFLSLGGGLILLSFGLFSLLKPSPAQQKIARANNNNTLMRQILRGFLLNGINPSVLLFWIGVVSLVSVEYKYKGYDIYVFFAAILITVLTTDILKSYLAIRLRSLFTTRLILNINRIVGLALIIFSLRLFYFAFHLETLVASSLYF
ncbi:MAG: LysE family translocator [Candidatus Cyclobacteriaceae bacterium M3_2C_046]